MSFVIMAVQQNSNYVHTTSIGSHGVKEAEIPEQPHPVPSEVTVVHFA